MGQDTKHAVPEDSRFWERPVSCPSSRSLHSLTVRRTGQPRKCREYHVVTCMGNNHELGVYNNSVDAVERALLERYFLCDVDGTFEPALCVDKSEFETNGLEKFKRLVVNEVRKTATVITLREVVQQYRGPKYRIYESAYKSLLRKRINRKDAKLKPFTKFEKQSLSKAPRIINPRSPRYNLVLGKYLKTNEKKYYKAINLAWGERTGHTVIKGLNVYESAAVMKEKWEVFNDPVAVGLDAKKFDMHVGVESLKYEHSYYNMTFGAAQLAKILTWQLHNVGRAYCADGEVDFKIPGTRCSGDLNTSLGNCILMCALFFDLCEELNIKAELANNGDDCVLFMERKDLMKLMNAVVPYFMRKGFRMTVEKPVFVFEEIEFCQSKPVLLPAGWAMVRNVRTCLKKDPMCLMPIPNEKVWRKWLGAVGECGLSLVSGCPVLQSFYGCFHRNGVSSSQSFKTAVFKNTGTMERGAGLGLKPRTVTASARASFYRATGITPDYQIELELYYDKMMIGGIDQNNVRDGMVENTPLPFIRHL